jgi:hypothetical protein
MLMERPGLALRASTSLSRAGFTRKGNTLAPKLTLATFGTSA